MKCSLSLSLIPPPNVTYAKNPSHSPFFFAKRIRPCACFVCTPICLQKSLMIWECREIALPVGAKVEGGQSGTGEQPKTGHGQNHV